MATVYLALVQKDPLFSLITMINPWRSQQNPDLFHPVEKIGTNTTFDPIKFPESLLTDLQFALHLAPAAP